MDIFNIFDFYSSLSTGEKELFVFGFGTGAFAGLILGRMIWHKATSSAPEHITKFLHSCEKLGKNSYPEFHAKDKKIIFSNCDYYNKGKCDKDGAKCSTFKKI